MFALFEPDRVLGDREARLTHRNAGPADRPRSTLCSRPSGSARCKQNSTKKPLAGYLATHNLPRIILGPVLTTWCAAGAGDADALACSAAPRLAHTRAPVAQAGPALLPLAWP
eukprot:3229532-Rhodomonas_salina.2